MLLWLGHLKLTPPSRPNKASLNVSLSTNIYVHPSIHKVFLITTKFAVQVEVIDYCTMVCHITRSKVKVTEV